MNLLCIDYGTKRIGLAVASSPLAEPLGVIANTENPRLKQVVTEQALGQILKVIAEFKIEKILVGISEGEMAEKTRHFIAELKRKTALPVEEVDETLSSVEAGAKQRQGKKRLRGEVKDHLAAAVVLQDYLDFAESV